MYIPIGPSKKDLYKIIIGLLLIVYLIFLGMYKPKALAITDITYIQAFSSGNGCSFNKTTHNEHETGFYIYGSGSPGNCSLNWTNFGDANYLVIPIIIQYYDVTSYVGTDYNYEFEIIKSSFMINLVTDVGNVYCDYDGTYATCPWKVADASNLSNISIVYGNTYEPSNKLSLRVANGWWTADTSANANNSIANNTNDIKNSINDSSIDNSSATSFKDNSAFQDSNGLEAIIKAPLNFIQSLTSSTCSNISLTIPYIDAQVSLPCMSTIYNKALGQQLVNLIALVINGVILYRYCLKILQIVKDAKNPNKDGLEVLDL